MKKKLNINKIRIAKLNKIKAGNNGDEISLFFEDDTACHTDPAICTCPPDETEAITCTVTGTNTTHAISNGATCPPVCPGI